jgi:hypothetical protein
VEKVALQSDEQGPEAKNQVINVIEHLSKHWEDRFTLSNPRLVENYVKGKVHFLVLIKDALKPENQLVAFIERALPILFIGDDVEIKDGTKVNVGGNVDPFFFEHGSGQPAPDKAGSSKVCHDGTNGYQEAVLVDIVKLVESPETVVPSLVRFGRVDSIYGRLRHALYFSFTRGFVLRGDVGVDYRETDLLAFGLAKDDALFSTADVNEMPNEMVKGTSHVLDSLPGEQRDNGSHRLDTSDIMVRECIGKLRMWLGSNFVRLTVQEGLDSRFQCLDVLVGPCDFYAGKLDSLVGS